MLARAVYKVGAAQVPAGALGAGGSGVLLRAQRLVSPPPALEVSRRTAVVLATAGLLALPALGLFLPLAG